MEKTKLEKENDKNDIALFKFVIIMVVNLKKNFIEQQH